jgi:hypothetical protein
LHASLETCIVAGRRYDDNSRALLTLENVKIPLGEWT